jgi:CBS domain-containing protein
VLPSVRTVMDSETYAFRAREEIRDALRVLIDEGITGAPVVDDNGELVGMISEYECLKLLTVGTADAGLPPGTQVADFMVPVTKVVNPDMDLYYVAGLFLADAATRRFPVVEGSRLVAVITRKDVLRAIAARA